MVRWHVLSRILVASKDRQPVRAPTRQSRNIKLVLVVTTRVAPDSTAVGSIVSVGIGGGKGPERSGSIAAPAATRRSISHRSSRPPLPVAAVFLGGCLGWASHNARA